MRVALVLALLVVCFISAPAYAMEWLGTVKVKSLRVHTGRDASTPVVKALSKNTKVIVEGQKRARSGKSWCGIRERMKGSTLGYVDCDGMTHSMTQRLYESLSSNPTSVSGVSAPAASAQSSASVVSAPAQARTQASAKRRTMVNGKDMTDRYKGKSAVMYMTPT